jgi:MoaA/NifB/PqqE/SkfB family radical SAM enzyme
MTPYKIAANMEWTSKCNARCVMCPQELIHRPQLMTQDTFNKTLERLSPDDFFRVVIAGYGEPTTHPKFNQFIDAVGKHPLRFDMATNGQELTQDKLRHLDGKLGLLLISFSSIDPEVYGKVHIKLDQQRVMQNIINAQKILKKTALGISLTPMASCLDTLPQTIAWLHQQGIELLTMSPTLYDRGGTVQHKLSTQRLRGMIKQYKLHSQELDFIPSIKDSIAQFRHNKFKCVPRNSDLFISASGDYLYCYNDITHRHVLGHINDSSVREILQQRESMAAIDSLCKECSMSTRYGAREIAQVTTNYLREKLFAVAKKRYDFDLPA